MSEYELLDITIFTVWTNQKLYTNLVDCLIKCCNAISYQMSEYELSDIIKPDANYWNSQYGASSPKQNLHH